MPAYRFEFPHLRRARLGPFTSAFVTVAAGILLAGIVTLVIAFGVFILAIAGAVGLIATLWHRFRRRIGPTTRNNDSVSETAESSHHHDYKLIRDAEIISVEEDKP